MAVDISTTARNDACDAVVDLVDAGTGAGTLEIRTGAQPANCAAADSGTLLANLTCNDPAFGAASAGVATLDVTPAVEDTNADNSGTPGHFRFKESGGTCHLQGSAGVGSGDINFDQTVVATGTVSITSLTVTMPESGA